MNFNRDFNKDVGLRQSSTTYDQGLRSYMLGVYNHMSLALAITGLVAVGVVNFPPLFSLMYNIGADNRIGFSVFGWIANFAPLGIILYMAFRLESISTQAAKIWFYILAATMGLSMSSIFIMYTGQSIAKTFFICSATFAGLSLYGYTTKKDLSGMATFLVMGLIGLIIASIVNIFVQSSAMHTIISFVGVLVFAGFTAYDTQNIKNAYYRFGANSKVAIMGALSLYIDFVNLFRFLLTFLGNRE